MITTVAVFDFVEGELKGGIRLKRSAELAPELLLLGQALQAAMSLTLQYHQDCLRAGTPAKPDENLKLVADQLAKEYHQWPPNF